MKVSRYNMFVEVPEIDRCFVYSGVSCKILRVCRSTYEKLKAGQVDTLVASDRALVDSQVVTKSHAGQVKVLKRRFENVMKPTQLCTFVISPTTECNLRCPYCYELDSIKRRTTMTQVTVRRVIRFICREMAEPARKTAMLKFYGGEPLLEADTCSQIANEVSEWCSRNGKKLITWVQTNGTLFPREWFDAPIPNLSVVEITIDGDKRTHDRIRTNVRRTPTYELITKTVCELASRRIPVSLRLNVHSVAELERALRDLQEAGVFDHEHVTFYDGQVSRAFFKRKFSAACFGQNCSKNHIELVETLRRRIKELGLLPKYQSYPLFRVRSGVCSFRKPGNYCIDPEGGLYSCVFRQSEPSQMVGHIGKDGSPVFNTQYGEILRSSPLSRARCARCQILPQCWGGGCMAKELDERKISQSRCAHLSSMLHEMLAATVRESVRK